MSDNSLALFRKVLQFKNVDAFIVGSGDAHQSEYVSDADERRQFISKFTGSAGTALILQNSAYLWTDGRYFLQAANELSSDWTLMKSGQPNVLELPEWVVATMKSGQTVGVDPLLIPNGQAKSMKDLFASKGITLVAVEENPVDEVWSQLGRPEVLVKPLRALGLEKTGLSHDNKIAKVQEFLVAQGASALLVTMLDDVAWLLNIRGDDVVFNPVVLAYAVVTMDLTYLFVDPAKVTFDVREHLGPKVAILPYGDVKRFLERQATEGKIIMDPAQVNWSLFSAAGESALPRISPIVLAKSLKNDVELEGFRQCHIRDGAALTAFFHWLEVQVKAGEKITEFDVTEHIERFRSKMTDHVGPSFGTIAGYGPNGAMMHYSPSKEVSATLGTDTMFLCDSGAQYLDGTTDVTRTMHFGTPTERMKQCYTAVLKGHIGLDRLVFPEGTLGSRFDCIARLPLWDLGLDFNHGTGHGVGSFLNVHEGPQGIGFRKRENEVGFHAGMTTSNEPGYYEDGNFGIRIENLAITVVKPTENNFQDKRYVGFETVTMSPIATNLIVVEQLTPAELTWLNEYHAKVRKFLLPVMTEHFPESVAYLVERTEPVGV
eukprot:gene9398-11062_t